MSEPENQTSTTPFWRFSLHFYRQAGVSDACIALQDEYGTDVNLFLFLMWLAAGSRQLSETDVKTLDDKVRNWRNLTIIPIRDARRKLKGAPTLVEPGKQEALYAVTKSGPLGRQAAPSVAARGNVAAYERVLDVTFPKTSLELLFGAFDGIEHGAFAGR